MFLVGTKRLAQEKPDYKSRPDVGQGATSLALSYQSQWRKPSRPMIGRGPILENGNQAGDEECSTRV
jgi:hypothetical protein